MNKRLVLAAVAGCALSICLPLSAQSDNFEARVSTEKDGAVVVSARGPRPLWQTVEALRRLYGWTLDCEESSRLPLASAAGAGKIAALHSGTLNLRIRKPANASADEETRFLQGVVNQYNEQSPVRYQLIRVGKLRFDLSPAHSPVLSQPVLIDSQQRSLATEIEAILLAVKNTTGASIVRGGFIDNELEQRQVSLSHTGLVPARELLAEVLDRASVKKVWLFTYEPTGGYYAIGFQHVEQWTQYADKGVR